MIRLIGTTAITVLLGTTSIAAAETSKIDFGASTSKAAIEAAEQGRPIGVHEWQRQFDKAEQRKGAGKKKIILGAITLGSGVALSRWAEGRCVTAIISQTGACGLEQALWNAGRALDWIGVGVAGWGTAQYFLASSELRRLDDQRPADSTAADATPRVLFAAPAPMLGYTLHW